jgi:tRNA-2-methylthio-N6-dimethylallyladenosine synthase
MVPIMTGCNNFCAYCVVPYARGREWSRPLEEIIAEIYKLDEKNYKEVTLLGQNVNSYQFTTHNSQNKKRINFPILLDTLAKQFPKITFKFLTSHPKDCSMELIDVISKNKNIPNELHLPIQAGSDKVLRDMNRPYTQKYYLNLINKIKKKIPDIKITTDIIIGFPTETDTDFLETVKIFKEVNFTNAYLNKYSPRPGTKAFDLEDPIEWKIKKEREQTLLNILGKK